MSGHDVVCYMYDISHGMARGMSQMIIGRQVDAIWHTSIVCYGKEYFFDGGVGIEAGIPGRTRFGMPIRQVRLGRTTKTVNEFETFNVSQMVTKFGPTHYHMLNNNCNHYTQEAGMFLCGVGPPAEVLDQVQNILGPMGMGGMMGGAGAAPSQQPSAPSGPPRAASESHAADAANRPNQPTPPRCSALANHADLMAFSAGAVPRVLIPRTAIGDATCMYTKTRGTDMLVCHDMAGNYTKADRSPHPHLEDGADGLYRMRHWDVVDTFVYFSHNFVSIPPFGWVNAAHRHGKRVLGTFLVEHKADNLKATLSCGDSIRSTIAKLVEVQDTYKFDGWLINVEVSLDELHAVKLRGFVDQLTKRSKELNPESRVIFYDSVLENGPLKYQNELNFSNKAYFEVCDGFFTNYWWKPQSVANSAFAASGRARDVYHGIDVFGRGTYGGGKFDSHKAVEAIVPHGASTALFAPAFTYENHGSDGRTAFEEADDMLWRNIRPHYAATATISSLPFFTSFSMASGEMMFSKGEVVGPQPWFDLSSSHPVPILPLKHIGGGAVRTLLTYEDVYEGGCGLEVAGDTPMGLLDFFAVGGAAATVANGGDVSFELVARGATVGLMVSGASCRYVLHPAESGDQASTAQLKNVYCGVSSLPNGWARYRWKIAGAGHAIASIALVAMKGTATIGRFAMVAGEFPEKYSASELVAPKVSVADGLLTIEFEEARGRGAGYSHADVYRTDGLRYEQWMTRTHNTSVCIPAPRGVLACRLEGVDAAGQPMKPMLIEWAPGQAAGDAVEVTYLD